MAPSLAPFLAGAIGALVLLRLLAGVINLIQRRRRTHVRTMVVLGSGGHTAEMMALLAGFDLSVYRPRCYVVAATDGMSGQKAAAFEAAAAVAAAAATAGDEEAPASARKRSLAKPRSPGGGKQAVRRSPRVAAATASRQQAAERAVEQEQAVSGGGSTPRRYLPGARSPESPAKRRLLAGQQAGQAEQQQQRPPYTVVSIPRSREVGQSFVSSVPSTLRALWAAVSVVLDHQPDLVLVNGPGTCIPIAAAAFLLSLLGVCGGRVVYVESIARVYRLSLSGKILYHSRLAHTFFVQWEELQQRYPRAVYAGRLM